MNRTNWKTLGINPEVPEEEITHRVRVTVSPRIWRERCTYAGEYKGIRPPKCGCATCWEIWDSSPQNSVATK